MVDPMLSALLCSSKITLIGDDEKFLGNLVPLIFNRFGPK